MRKIIFNDFDKNLLIWKYRGKINKGLHKNMVSVPYGFFAVVKQYDGNFTSVFGGYNVDFTAVSDIYFVRKHIEPQTWGVTDLDCAEPETGEKTFMKITGKIKFSVRDAKELVKNISGLGPEIKISYFWIREFLEQLRPAVKNAISQNINIIKKDINIIPSILEIENKNNFSDISSIFYKYGLLKESFIVTHIK